MGTLACVYIYYRVWTKLQFYGLYHQYAWGACINFGLHAVLEYTYHLLYWTIGNLLSPCTQMVIIHYARSLISLRIVIWGSWTIFIFTLDFSQEHRFHHFLCALHNIRLMDTAFIGTIVSADSLADQIGFSHSILAYTDASKILSIL